MVLPFVGIAGTAEIVGVGRVRRASGMGMEPEFDVLLASDLHADGFDTDRDCEVVRVGCGQLDLLTVGSRWADGRPAGRAKALPIEAEISLVGITKIGIVAETPISSVAPFPTRRIAGAPAFLARLADVNGWDGAPPRMASIQFTELFRVLFGVSSTLAFASPAIIAL